MSSQCVCHLDEWCFYCEVYSREVNELKAQLSSLIEDGLWSRIGESKTNYEVELVNKNKLLLTKSAVYESQADHYKRLWAESCARYNRLQMEYKIAKEALEHIAEHNFIPPANFVDVASDALYRIGEVEAEKGA